MDNYTAAMIAINKAIGLLEEMWAELPAGKYATGLELSGAWRHLGQAYGILEKARAEARAQEVVQHDT